MATQPDAPAEMTFDSSPVQQDTPVQGQTPQTQDLGMTFDSTSVQKETPVDQLADSRTPEEQAFLKAHPDHAYLKADPKFPNRPEGIYPTGPGNDWRKDTTVSQEPVDPELLKHSVQYGLGSAAATGLAAGLPAAGEALYDLAVKHLAGNVLPGMETEAAKAKLLEMAPKVYKVAKELGIAGTGITLLWKAVMGGSGAK